MQIKYLKLVIMIIGLPVLIPIGLAGQEVLYTDNIGIGKCNIQTCTYERFCIREYSPPPSPFDSDITITPNGDIYANSVAGISYMQKVNVYNNSNSEDDSCYYNKESWDLNFFDGQGGIISNKKGELFCAATFVLKYFPTTKKWEFIGDLHNFHTSLGKNGSYLFPGLLTRRDNEYYYVTRGVIDTNNPNETFLESQKLVKLDTLIPENSTDIYDFPNDIHILLMFTIRESCDIYTTYIKYRYRLENAPVDRKNRILGIFDFETGVISDICVIDSTFDYDFLRGGVAVPWTIMDSDCKLIVDLDMDNSSGAIGRYDFIDTSICKYDEIFLSDIDPEVFAYNVIDSLRVFFLDMPPDGNNEYIEGSTFGGVNIVGNGTQNLTLTNNDPADFDNFQYTVRSLQYRNSSSSPTAGERQIGFLAYYNARLSDTAVSHIILLDEYLVAGKDSIIELCEDDPIVDMHEFLSENVKLSGKWSKSTIVEWQFDPKEDEQGIYQYIIGREGCKADTANIEIIVNKLPIFDLGRDTILCLDESILLSCDIDAAIYKWQDGSQERTYEVKDSGLYILEISDNNGCFYKDSIKIGYYPSDQNSIEVDTIICYGEDILWNNQSINSSGDYEYSSSNIFGCDSLTILHVSYYPQVEVNIVGNDVICDDEIVVLNGGDATKYIWSTGETTKDIEISKGGWYYLEIANEQGCTAKDSLYVEQIEAIHVEIEIKPETCYNDNDGELVIHYISGGKGNIDYYLDGEQISESSITDLSPGMYSIEAIDSTGCRWTEEIIIDSAPQYWVNLGDDINVTDGTQIQIETDHNIEGIETIQWYINGELSPKTDPFLLIAPTQNTKIEVVITTTDGCKLRDELYINHKDKLDVYIPNIFTPDGDGLNDIWKIQGSNQIQEIEKVEIYDRWGNKLLQKEHISFNPSQISIWDGRYKNRLVNSGVYIYILKLKLHSGETILKAGDITVIR